MGVFRNRLVQGATTEVLWTQCLLPSWCLLQVQKSWSLYFKSWWNIWGLKLPFFFFFLVILHHDGIITTWNRWHADMLRCFHLCDHRWHLNLSRVTGKDWLLYTIKVSAGWHKGSINFLTLEVTQTFCLKPSPSVALTRSQRPREEHPLFQYHSARNPGCMGFPKWLRWQRIHLQCRRPAFDPWVGKIPWRREQLPIPVFLPGEFHGPRSLAGYSLRDCKELDMTEQLSLAYSRTSNKYNHNSVVFCVWLLLFSVI